MGERLSRDAVVARAADLSDEIGLGEVTITKVARVVGIAAPGVYRHVADADDLRRAIGVLGTDELARLLAEATAGRSRSEALAAMAAGLRGWAAAHPGRYAAVQIAPSPDDAAGQAAAVRLLGVFEAVLRGYALDADDFTDAIRFVRSAVHGFVDMEASGGFKQPRPVDASFGRIVEALDLALANWRRRGA